MRLRQGLGIAAALAHVAWIFDAKPGLHRALPRSHGYFQRVMVTRVPTPTVDSISNSLTRRLLPVKPKPGPVPEPPPSVIASSTLGMPGPRSSNVNRKPRFPPSLSRLHFSTPPPP